MPDIANKPGALFVLAFFVLFGTALGDNKPDLTWVSPSAGDSYGPGDVITGKWTSDKTLVSPAFKICKGTPQSSMGSRSEDEGNDSSNGVGCGEKVYPTVQQESNTYSVTLSVPDTNTTTKRSEQSWFLQMQDDFQNTWASPSFTISSSEAQNPASAQAAPTPGAQAPLSVPSPTSSSPVGSTAIPVPVAEPEAVTSAAATNLLATRNPTPVAAFAVPLSIVAAILLAAAFLSFRHNRKLAQERAQDVEKLVSNLSRKSSNTDSCKSGFSRQSDIEHALNVLSKAHPTPATQLNPIPVPLYMPMEVPVQREARRSTREAYFHDEKQYTEYRSRPERPPSYRSAPFSSHRLRSDSISSSTRPRDSRASLYSMSYSRPHSRASHTSRTIVNPYSYSRPHSRSSQHYLPPLEVGSPLCFEKPIDSHGDHHSHRQPRYGRAEEDCVTDSVLDDYLDTEPSPLPPPCLMPAPQRLHVRNVRADAPSRIEEEDDDMHEVDLYDAVADNLKRARREHY